MIAAGPSDPLRSRSAASLLPAARRAGKVAGVTRLAEITRLDRFGLPVWQAVRPWSRALSVHQGKGASDAEAQVGALLEAVESHQAESFDADGPTGRFQALAARERAADFADFAADRATPPDPDATYRWTAAENVVSGGKLHLPFDLVSLDLTRAVPSLFDRASNGVATGTSRDEALAVALHELVERDAVMEWQARGAVACTASVLRVETVDFDWFRHWIETAEKIGASLRFYHVPTLTRTPLFVCEINDGIKSAAPYRATHGRGCHPLPEIALFKAFAEAVQSRAGFIAGARDDALPSLYSSRLRGCEVAFGLPLPVAFPGVDWPSVAPTPEGAEPMIEALVSAGYPQVTVVELGLIEEFHVVRAFVCGLGSIVRRRREPR